LKNRLEALTVWLERFRSTLVPSHAIALVITRQITVGYTDYGAPNNENFDLCSSCYQKRLANEPPEPKEDEE